MSNLETAQQIISGPTEGLQFVLEGENPWRYRLDNNSDVTALAVNLELEGGRFPDRVEAPEGWAVVTVDTDVVLWEANDGRGVSPGSSLSGFVIHSAGARSVTSPYMIVGDPPSANAGQVTSPGPQQ